MAIFEDVRHRRQVHGESVLRATFRRYRQKYQLNH